MKKYRLGMLILFAVIVLGTVSSLQAATLEQAKAFGIKAAAYVKANGKEKSIAEFNNPGGRFMKGELYVTLHDTKGIFLASPADPSLAGQNHFELKDQTGKYFVKEMIEIAKTKGGGWIIYRWTNPTTKKIQAKKAWVQRVKDTDLYTLSGIFQ